MTIAKREQGASARRAAIAGGITAAALLLAACSGGLGGAGDAGPMGTGNADGQGNFGSTMQTTSVAPAVSAGAFPNPGSPNDDQTNFTCPKVEVRGGAASWQVTDKADGGIRYQATLARFSRECSFTSPDMTMRVGIRGRVLLGPKGGPGLVNVPIRVAVVEEGPAPKPVWTRLYVVPVQIGAEVMQLDFSMVAEEPSFPRPDAATLERYVVYVGFDSQADVAETKPKPRSTRPRPVAAKPAAPKPAAPKPVATTAPKPAASAQAAPASTARPAASASNAPIYGTAQPAQRQAAPSGNSQWIGAPAPASGGFMTPTQ